MKWEMEVDEIESVHEKILDLHDKLSEAIHCISRSHFLKSRKKKTGHDFDDLQYDANNGNQVKSGFVFVKEFRINEDENAVHDAKSLDAIRTALENLEDQLEFYNILQSQQRGERDAAIARLEQSRIILAMRLSEYQGRKYKFIEDAQALVRDVHDASQFVPPEKHDYPATSNPDKKFVVCDGKRPNAIFNVIFSSLNFVKKSLKVDQVGGILGNAALVAISMLTLMHLQQVAGKEKYNLNLPFGHDDVAYHRDLRSSSQPERSSSGHLTHLDVLSARG